MKFTYEYILSQIAAGIKPFEEKLRNIYIFLRN